MIISKKKKKQIIKERSCLSEDEKVLFLDRLLKISEENSDFTMDDVIGEGNTALMAVIYANVKMSILQADCNFNFREQTHRRVR